MVIGIIKKGTKKAVNGAKVSTNKTKEAALKLKEETVKAVTTALVAAFGFIIALSWRDYLNELFEGINQVSPLQGKLASALIITILSVVGIMIVTKFGMKKEKDAN